MAGPAIHAHAFLACLNTTWDGPPGPRPPRTLEHVNFSYRTDTPDGFPFETELWLFTRLSHRRARGVTKTLDLTLVWHDDPEARPQLWTHRYQAVTLRPGVRVRDVAARADCVFEGPGDYDFVLWYRVVRGWDQTVRRRVIGRTSVRIEG